MNMPYFSNTILPVIFPVFFIALVFYIIFHSNKGKRKALNRLSGFLRGSLSKSFFTPAFDGEFQGLKFSISPESGGKNSPDYLKISLFKTSLLRLFIYKESALSELGKKIGILREIKVNDAAFDKEFLILANKPDLGSAYLANSAARVTIKNIFDEGFSAIVIDGKKIVIQKPNYNLLKDLDPSKISSIIQKVALLANGLQ